MVINLVGTVQCPVLWNLRTQDRTRDIAHVCNMSGKSLEILNFSWKQHFWFYYFLTCVPVLWRSELFENALKSEIIWYFLMLVDVWEATCMKAPLNWYSNVCMGNVLDMIWAWQNVLKPYGQKQMSRHVLEMLPPQVIHLHLMPMHFSLLQKMSSKKQFLCNKFHLQK